MGDLAAEALPRFGVDLGFQRGLERLVGVVHRAGEVGVADEEALAVVVGVEEPAGDLFRARAADVAGLGVEHIHPEDADPKQVAVRVLAGRLDLDDPR